MATFESAIKLEPTNVQTSFGAPYQDETAITIDKEDLASVSVLHVSVKLRSHIATIAIMVLPFGRGGVY